MEEIKEIWQKKKAFRVWAKIMGLIALLLFVSLLGAFHRFPWIALIGEALYFWLLWLWLKRILWQIGTIELPSQAVKARFGNPVDAVGPGLHFALWPFEKFKEFPTGQYVVSYKSTRGLYSLEKGKLKSQPIKVEVSVYWRWPRVDRNYSFPMLEAEVRAQIRDELQKAGQEPTDELIERELKKRRKGLRAGLAWGRKSGKELLMTTFRRLPIKDLKTASIKEFGLFFEKGVRGGLRYVISAKTSEECKEKQPEIEEAIKTYLLSEEGNPFFECGLPKECLDVELVELKLPDETEEAYIKPELARKEAEAAVSEKTATKRRIEGYIEEGVPETLAGLLVGGAGGKGMTMEQLRDFGIYTTLFPLPGFGASKRPTKEEIVEALKKLSPEEIEKILRELKEGRESTSKGG